MQSFPAGAFFASVAQKLQPRFYSISSSPAADPNVISLTCAVVRSITPTGWLPPMRFLKMLPVCITSRIFALSVESVEPAI